MAKAFKDAFPTLQLDEELESLLDTTEVTKISANHDRSQIRVYLHATRLIFKNNIWKIEDAIRTQIFQNQDVTVKVIESFQLSEQYTPESLMDVYKDSILEELNAYSVLEYNLLRTAAMEFDQPHHMILTLDETIIAKTRTEEILEFLEKVICERCGMNLVIQPVYRQPEESKYRKNSEKQIAQEVQSILERTRFAIRGDEGEPLHQPENEKNTQDVVAISDKKSTVRVDENNAKVPKDEGNNAKKKPAFEKKGEFRRKFESENSKKSSNPDVIYGRDFEEETMEIEKIDGPIGEVVIHGQILSVDTREIRNEKTIVIFSMKCFSIYPIRFTLKLSEP